MGTGRQKIGVKIFGKQVQHVGDIPENQYQKNCDLQQSFQRLHNTAQGKQPFHSLQRLIRLSFGLRDSPETSSFV